MWLKQCRKARLRVISLPLLLIAVVVLASCAAGPQPKGWSGGAISDKVMFVGSIDGKMVAVDLVAHTKLWTTPLETGKATSIYGDPAVAKDLVYVGAYNGKVYAFNTGSGLSRNQFLDETNPQPIIGGALVALGKIYIGSSDKKIYALNSDTLGVEWKFPTENKVWSTPAIDKETIFVTSLDKKIYALDANTGDKKWEYKTEGAISATPVVDNQVVYFGSFDRHIYALNTRDGSLKWKSKIQAGNWFWTKVIVSNDTVYAPSLDGKVYILNARTGEVTNVAIDIGSPISANPVRVGNSVILAAQNGKVYAIDTTNYQKRQLNDLSEKVYASLAAGDDTVYIHASDFTLRAMHAGTGTVQWTLPLNK